MQRRPGIERELASRADQRVSRWFGPVRRMDKYSITRMVVMVDVDGGYEVEAG